MSAVDRLRSSIKQAKEQGATVDSVLSVPLPFLEELVSDYDLLVAQLPAHGEPIDQADWIAMEVPDELADKVRLPDYAAELEEAQKEIATLLRLIHTAIGWAITYGPWPHHMAGGEPSDALYNELVQWFSGLAPEEQRQVDQGEPWDLDGDGEISSLDEAELYAAHAEAGAHYGPLRIEKVVRLEDLLPPDAAGYVQLTVELRYSPDDTEDPEES